MMADLSFPRKNLYPITKSMMVIEQGSFGRYQSV